MSSRPASFPAIKGFVEAARWFGGKGREFEVTELRRLGVVPTGTDARAAIDLATVSYADGEVDFYQLPMAMYDDPQERLAHALIGHWEDPDFGLVHVYDALHDREAMQGWLSSFASPPAETPLRFTRVAEHDFDLHAHSTLFSGEQSNSSVAFGDDSLMKVFRKITPGINPDISVHAVLTQAGSDHVAALYGWLEVDDSAGAPLQLAMLQQFLRTATDGWDLALASVRNLYAEGDLHADEVGGDFAAEAARLGVALAEVHETLAAEFPTVVRSVDDQRAVVAAMNQRLDVAVATYPELAASVAGLRELFADAAEVPSVDIQQIHGDLHLGQTLRTVKGWKIVDFEGEPAKPLADRALPDSRWRDVAGMLRSFDYAPHAVAMTATGDEATEQRAFRAKEWTERNCSAFLSGYAGGSLNDAEQALLSAYVADKAVYEVGYEARNRPTWLAIPLAAIEELALGVQS